MKTLPVLTMCLFFSLVPAAAQSALPPAPQASGHPAAGTAPASPGQVRPAPSPTAASPARFPATALELNDLLGMDLAQAFARFGVPQEVFAMRGEQAWQDDVVFYYADNLYLFWYGGRVWQIRLDRRFAGRVGNLRMGMSRAEATAVYGEALQSDETSAVFQAGQRGFPLKARLVFGPTGLEDFYLYRGDF